MPYNFGLEGYLSEGDPEFPWYQDDGVRTNFECSRSGENTKVVQGSGKAAEDAAALGEGAENAEGAEDVAAEGVDPPVV